MNLQELLSAGSGQDIESSWPAQVAQIRESTTQGGKPYYDLELADATGSAKLKIWSDTPAFSFCQDLQGGELIALDGIFFSNQYGLNVNRPEARFLGDDEVDLLLAGSEEYRLRAEADWEYVISIFGQMKDPRLKAVALQCLGSYEAKWKRAAAARTYHHAKRGGLLEHTASMLRLAESVSGHYPEVTPELLYCGVLFHDIGKLWENDYPEKGFVSQPTRLGELLGHITIGIEVVNRLWNQCQEEDPEAFSAQHQPPAEILKEHLLHLIAAHHGEIAFGSPVTPKTPEAWLLHHIDNMDAKIEMLRCAYRESEEIAPGLYPARRPLAGLPVRPLSQYL